MKVPLLDLKAQYAAIKAEVDAAIGEVMESQHFILGPEVESLEDEIAEFVGCRFAIACASGSDALLLALMALGIGPGDEVVTTPFTFVATAGSIARLGSRSLTASRSNSTCRKPIRCNGWAWNEVIRTRSACRRPRSTS